jgi:hypothetical protein
MPTPPVGPKNTPPSIPPSLFDKEPYTYFMTTLAQSPFKDLTKGIFLGWIEVGIDQPLVSATKIVQRRIQDPTSSATPFWKTLSVRQLYGGALANGTGMSLITGMQISTIGWTKQLLAQGKDASSLSLWQQVFASSIGAIAASPFASFSELVMDKYRDSIKRYEEQDKKGTRPTYARVTREALRYKTCGLSQTIGRDAGFVVAYDSLAPYFTTLLLDHASCKSYMSQQQIVPVDLVATIVGSVFAGVLGITLTHPLDTWKTQRQAGLKTVFWPRGISPILAESFQLMHHDRRIEVARLDRRISDAVVYLFKNLTAEPYKGFSFRFMRGVSAVTIFNVVGWYFESTLAKYQSI